MRTIYAVMWDTGYDGPDEIIQLYETEENAKEHLKRLLQQDKFSYSTDYYINEYDVL